MICEQHDKCARIILMTVAILLTCLSMSAAKDENTSPKNSSEKDVVIKVNDTTIPQVKFMRSLDMIKNQYATAGVNLNERQLHNLKMNIAKTLIGKELLYRESRKLGIKVEESEINSDYQKLKSQFAGNDKFLESIRSLNYTEKSLKDQIKRTRAIKKLIQQEISSGISISKEDITAFYDNNPGKFKQPERIKASHILVKVDPKADDAEKEKARKKINAIEARLEKGEDFAAVAKEVSDCPSGKRSGGDLGYFSRKKVVKPFSDAAFALKTGETSAIVETKYGFHIIKLTGREPASVKKLEDVKKSLRAELKEQKIREEISSYIKVLEEKATIEINIPGSGSGMNDQQ